jgi:hypothetical protein
VSSSAHSWLAPVALSIAAAALFALDRSLAADEATARDMRDTIGRLIRKEERDTIPLAAITVEIGEHEKYTYAKLDERWRLLDGRNAIADQDALERLWKSFLEGEGVVHSKDRNRLAEYGFSNTNVIRVALHGPEVQKKKDRDVRWRCELGNRIEDLEGCYVRREGSSYVWAMDSDPRAIIESSRSGMLPPLLEGTLISRSWMQTAGQNDTFTVALAGAPPFTLKLEQIPIDPADPEAMRSGKDPFKWTATSGGAEVTVEPRTAMAYYQVLLGAKANRLLDPKDAPNRGIDTAKLEGGARIDFGSGSTTKLSLVLSPPAPDGARAVWNSESKTLVEIDGELATLLLPAIAELGVASAENPWQAYLAKQQAATQPQSSIQTPPNVR